MGCDRFANEWQGSHTDWVRYHEVKENTYRVVAQSQRSRPPDQYPAVVYTDKSDVARWAQDTHYWYERGERNRKGSEHWLQKAEELNRRADSGNVDKGDMVDMTPGIPRVLWWIAEHTDEAAGLRGRAELCYRMAHRCQTRSGEHRGAEERLDQELLYRMENAERLDQLSDWHSLLRGGAT